LKRILNNRFYRPLGFLKSEPKHQALALAQNITVLFTGLAFWPKTRQHLLTKHESVTIRCIRTVTLNSDKCSFIIGGLNGYNNFNHEVLLKNQPYLLHPAKTINNQLFYSRLEPGNGKSSLKEATILYENEISPIL